MRASRQSWARSLVLIAACSAGALSCLRGAPAPEVSLSLRGLNGDALEQGEPLRIGVRLAAPRGTTEAMELAPASGSWVDALIIQLVLVTGDATVARAQPLGAPASASATLDRSRVAGGTWVFSAEAMQRVAVGEYRVQARLAIAAGRGWTGAVDAQPAPLRIVAPSAEPARIAARALGRAQLAAAGGKLEDAARLADAALAQNPDHFELLCLRADVALRAGNPLAARLCVSRAARLLPAKPTGPAPLSFQDVSQRVAAAKFPANAPTAKPPEWTWPPATVMRFPEIEKELATRRPATAAASGATATPPSATAAAAAPSPLPATSPAAAPAEPPAGIIVPAAELDDNKIRADAAGQWAASATAKSSYSNPNYGPAKATGAPDVSAAGDSIDAWCPGQQNSGTDWLEVAFAKPTRAIEVRVRQSQNPGAIAKVEAFAPDGRAHTWWEGSDPYQAPAIRSVAWFAVRVPPTAYAVAKIKLTLNLAAGPGWKQIDAVQLVAAP